MREYDQILDSFLDVWPLKPIWSFYNTSIESIKTSVSTLFHARIYFYKNANFLLI